MALRDLGREIRRREALAAREQFFRLVAQNSTDLIALHEVDGTYVYVSPSIVRLTGHEPYEVLGEPPWEVAHPEDADRVRTCFAAAAGGDEAEVTYRLRTKEGRHAWFETLARPVHLSSGGADEVVQVESTSRDVTARKQLERQLERQALHDQLTDLPNRTLFMDRLRQAPGRAERSGHRYGILFLDLDGFKSVNDTFGHAAGDELLAGVADRLRDLVRRTDTVARLSGDEFAVLLEEIGGADDAELLAERFLGGFSRPFRVLGRDLEVRPSIGVAVAREGESPEKLLRRADLAMYAAKRDADLAYLVDRDPR